VTVQRIGAASAPSPVRDTGLGAAPWLALSPAGAVEVDLRLGHRGVVRRARRLSPGTPVVLIDDRPLSRPRLRRLARRTAMAVERELIVLPTASSPVVVLDDTAEAVRHFWQAVAAVPPGLARASLPATVVLRLARSLPWTWTGAIAPGRVVLGVRR
jgi:hypothetical protein